MSSTRAANPVKLFVVISTTTSKVEGIEQQLLSGFGPIDHRFSVIPMGESMHRVFISFGRLVETSAFADIQRQANVIGKGFSADVTVGFLDNRRVFELRNDALGEDIIHFQNGAIEFHKSAPTDYRSTDCQTFFLSMRKLYRTQLRSMCLLKR